MPQIDSADDGTEPDLVLSEARTFGTPDHDPHGERNPHHVSVTCPGCGESLSTTEGNAEAMVQVENDGGEVRCEHCT